MTVRPTVAFLAKPISRFKRNYSHDVKNSYYDIIISGGGMIGQTMACALSKNPMFKNLSILLIESSPEKKYRTPESYSNRVSSVVPSTQELFLKLGMWKHISRYQEVKEMKVWGSYSHDYIHFSHDIGKPAYIIENDEIINAAVLENSSAPNVKIIYGVPINKVNLCQESPRLHEITLSNDALLKTSFLIGADGANSSIRNAMNVNYVTWKYDQFGIVGTLNLMNEIDCTVAWQKFLPDGPIAILPLKTGLCSLVWSVTEKKAKELFKLPEEVFVDALNEALNSDPIKNVNVNKLSEFSKSCLNTKTVKMPLVTPYVSSLVRGSRAMFPYSFGHSTEYYKPGVVLIGDSAHKVHPLAGQGVNIGFRDIRCLTEKLAEGIVDGRPLGDSRDLKHYETEAQRNNIPIMAAIEIFHRVYTSENDLIRAVGDVCIHFAESITPVKSLMKQLATS